MRIQARFDEAFVRTIGTICGADSSGERRRPDLRGVSETLSRKGVVAATESEHEKDHGSDKDGRRNRQQDTMATHPVHGRTH